jgi:hypothetical protein
MNRSILSVPNQAILDEIINEEEGKKEEKAEIGSYEIFFVEI